jgi:hypothetical protein
MIDKIKAIIGKNLLLSPDILYFNGKGDGEFRRAMQKFVRSILY